MTKKYKEQHIDGINKQIIDIDREIVWVEKNISEYKKYITKCKKQIEYKKVHKSNLESELKLWKSN